MKIKDYELVNSYSSGTLSERVKVLIREGFQPYGRPFVKSYIAGLYFYQVMVKEELEDANSKTI